MAGVPLLNGFLSKEMFFEETLAAQTGGGGLDMAPALVVVVASAFSVIYSLRFVGGVFYGRAPQSFPKTPRWMLAPTGFLAFACVLVGTLPYLTIGPYLTAGAAAVLGQRTPQFTLAVWHGFTPPRPA
jgi:multicomponent K+:H+ antiporter subunit A